MSGPHAFSRVCSYCRSAIGDADERLPTSHGACRPCAEAARQALDDERPMGVAALESALADARAQANRWHAEYVTLRKRHDALRHALAVDDVALDEAYMLVRGGDSARACPILREALSARSSRPPIEA